MKKVVLMLAASLSLVACKQNAKNQAQTEKVAIETEQVIDTHDAEHSLSYFGVYEGVIPAADCPGIEVKLILHEDQTFELHEAYIDREDSTFTEKGSFSVDANHLILFKAHDEESNYKIEEGRLRMLDMQGNEITGELADHYLLNQTKVFGE